MIKRTIEISGQGNRLSVALGSLIIQRDSQEVGRVPLEDLGVLILDAPDTLYTHWVLAEALAAGAVVVPCGRDHLPCGLFLPQNNRLQTQRLAAQVAAPLPLKKRLWKQIVQAKVRHQAQVLDPDHPARRRLLALVSRVRSGDPTNIEAQAARIYWQALFGLSFRRNPDAEDGTNALLNYGYAVVRAAVARAISGAGLHPSFGLHHHNRGNPFALADDLLEPLRPIVDRKAKALTETGQGDIAPETKREILGLLTEEVEVAGLRGPLLVALERTVASLVRSYQGEQAKLDLPAPCN
ncbi:MAG: type II CRISPR-associated endonuclease Cas1 [Phycisphaerae bacterium]